jgi:hypothetical protein
MNGRRLTGIIFLCVGLVFLALKFGRIFDPTPNLEKTWANFKPSLAKTVGRIPPAAVVYGGMIGLPALIGVFLLLTGKTSRAKSDGTAVVTTAPVPAVVKTPARRSAPVQGCNVLAMNGEGGKLWQFDSRNGAFVLAREQKSVPGEPLPARIVTKDWRALYQRKLNIAWLPPENVFLRVAQLPMSSFADTIAMVELQLEKLSPMAVTQIVWSLQVLPQTQTNMQTVVVVIVARDVVESFLGKLEGQGFLPDRIELPMLDQLQATPVRGDGAWIYPETKSGTGAALVAWWYGGVLHNLDLINLTAGGRAASAREQLLQMAWAGEMEGWLSSPPQWHLVADAATAAEWEPDLRQGLEQDVEVITPVAERDLAGLTARRAAHADNSANLLPGEFSERYRQQFYDRLWMRGLFAIFAIYVVAVLIYLVALQVANYRTNTVEEQVASMGSTYTNSQQLKARMAVLDERQALKYAALDCYRTVAQLMPESLTLERMNFAEGKRLNLSGTAPREAVKDIYAFEASMRKATAPTANGGNGDLLFEPNGGDTMNYQSSPGTMTVTWHFGLLLNRSEEP